MLQLLSDHHCLNGFSYYNPDWLVQRSHYGLSKQCLSLLTLALVPREFMKRVTIDDTMQQTIHDLFTERLSV